MRLTKYHKQRIKTLSNLKISYLNLNSISYYGYDSKGVFTRISNHNHPTQQGSPVEDIGRLYQFQMVNNSWEKVADLGELLPKYTPAKPTEPGKYLKMFMRKKCENEFRIEKIVVDAFHRIFEKNHDFYKDRNNGFSMLYGQVTGNQKRCLQCVSHEHIVVLKEFNETEAVDICEDYLRPHECNRL